MKIALKTVPGSVVAPQGFLASGVFCDIKRLGTGKGSNKGRKRDLALIVSEVPSVAVGLFTTNQVCAAPVKLCINHLEGRVAQAIVVNSGNANACTGRQGLQDAEAMAVTTAAECQRRAFNSGRDGAGPSRKASKTAALQMPAEHVLVASTGRIGVAMPMANVRAGISAAVDQLGRETANADAASEAIITSDTRSKQIGVEFKMSGRTVRLGGICKGAGMIQPGMSADGQRPAALPHATMLCFLTTDAAIQARTLQACLDQAVAQSFNRITVDGDMSTNDTVLLLANGLAGNPESETRNPRARARVTFQAALDHVCLELAKMIVRDGEGVTRFVTVRVSGAETAVQADAAARAVANSALVKTSWCGGDPNWGRIMGALGYSPATIVEDKVDIGYSAPASRDVLWSLRGGRPTSETFKALCAAVAPKEFDLHIRLNLGKAGAILYAADLTEDYVEFNKGDVTDPSSLGG